MKTAGRMPFAPLAITGLPAKTLLFHQPRSPCCAYPASWPLRLRAGRGPSRITAVTGGLIPARYARPPGSGRRPRQPASGEHDPLATIENGAFQLRISKAGHGIEKAMTAMVLAVALLPGCGVFCHKLARPIVYTHKDNGRTKTPPFTAAFPIFACVVCRVRMKIRRRRSAFSCCRKAIIWLATSIKIGCAQTRDG